MLNGLFKCDDCGFTAKNSSNMRSHVESKHYSPGYHCSICGKVFKLRNAMKQHYKKYHTVKNDPLQIKNE